MMDKLEKLLKKCIEMGCNPFGYNFKHIELTLEGKLVFYRHKLGVHIIYSLNDLCSIESGFWSFVCENHLLKNKIYSSFDYEYRCGDEVVYMHDDYQYRLMKSALQKDKTAFILDNVKLDA